MALDPNIALGIRGIEIANPIAQYAQVSQIQNAQNQNALAQYQLATAQREQESVNALNEAYRSAYNPQTGDIDINTLRKTLSTGGFGSKLPGLEKTLGELQTQKLTAQKLQGEVAAQPTKLEADRTKLVDDKLKQSRQFLDTINPADPNAPQQYFNWFQANHADPILGPTLKARGITEEQFVAKIQQAMNQGPQAFAELLNQSKLGTEKFMELNKPSVTAQNTGGFARLLQTPGLGGTATVVPGSAAPITMNEYQIAANQIAQQQANTSAGQLALARENAVKPVFNAEAGGFVSPPTKANPQGAFTPLGSIQENKDQQAAVKALKSAGYDPTTGEDTISKLIAKSTSGGLQAGTTAAIAFFGKSTEGRKAIAALEGTANQIATDLAGGKLGAGISNTDRDFIVGALGDVANPMKTSAERLAGWTAAKDRMMRVGLIPPPKGMDQGTAAKGAGPASAGSGSIRDQADAILRGSN
jgi:hypothetical protein